MLFPRLSLLVVLGFGLSLSAKAQAPTFMVDIVEVAASNAPAFHSAAHAEYDGLWVVVGGRIDGLHILFGGPDAFPAALSNNSIFVYDPDADQLWSASLDELSDAVADPLRTTNAQFWQDDDTLYYVGGYGYENASMGKITFGNLTAIDLPGIIDAVQNATTLSTHIRQMASDDRLKVTGGHLIEFDGTYHLVGGNRFDGEYLGGFTQVYTEAVRSFDIDDDGTTLGISNYAEMSDAANLHRRDVNVGPVVLNDGSEGFALFGGVFQISQNLPWTNPVYFDGSTMSVDTGFDAQFGHYTQPMIPLYSEADEVMHTVFIGGMNQFYYDEDMASIEEDTLVPFTDDVTAISRNSAGTTVETVMPFTLPGLLGTNAAFVADETLDKFGNGVFKLDEINGRALVGHMFGGIESDMPNAGWFGGTTNASDRVFEVYITGTVSAEEETPESFEISAPYPNPFGSKTHLNIRLDEPQVLSIELFDVLGKRIALIADGQHAAGPHSFAIDGSQLAEGVYVLRVSGQGGTVSRRIVHVN